ncbi:MAG: trigger factor [Burkholderiaceae bacterium]
MNMQVENLGKLERRLHISVPVDEIEKEVDSRLKRLARTVKMAGFRPGKVPMKIVSAQYGFKVHNEVLNEKIGGAFNRAVQENQLRVAGSPNITAAQSGEGDTAVSFDATFEIYPEVTITALENAEVTRAKTGVDEAAVDKTIEILRQQRSHFHSKAAHGHHDGHAAPADTPATAQPGDRVTVDFVGKIDGEAFEGGSGQDFAFVLGEGRMLPEFETAATGLAAGETKSFDLRFPDDYHGAAVAGKTAQFELTVKDVEWVHVPPIDEEFARSLGVADGDLDKMRVDVRANLDREVRKRLQARTKDSVMNALLASAQMDVPKALIDAETERLIQNAGEEMRRRGMSIDSMPLTSELFSAQAERRVRLGLVLAELVKNEELQARPDQIKAHIEDLAQSYEKPAEVVRWYFADRSRLGEVEALVLEENVVNFVLGKARVSEIDVPFDELMSNA